MTISLGMSYLPEFGFAMARGAANSGLDLARSDAVGLTREQLRAGLDAVAAREPAIAAALARVGYPEPRIREPGYRTLLRTIVGQQVSVAAAERVEQARGAARRGMPAPERSLAPAIDELRACGPVAPEAGLCALAVRAGG